MICTGPLQTRSAEFGPATHRARSSGRSDACAFASVVAPGNDNSTVAGIPQLSTAEFADLLAMLDGILHVVREEHDDICMRL